MFPLRTPVHRLLSLTFCMLSCISRVYDRSFSFPFFLGNVCSTVNLSMCLPHSPLHSWMKIGNARFEQKQECDSQIIPHWIPDLCYFLQDRLTLLFWQLARPIRSHWFHPLSPYLSSQMALFNINISFCVPGRW